MLEQKEIEALRDGSFVLECPRIKLTQLGVDSPRVLQGPGRFAQASDGTLRVEVFVVGAAFPSMHLIPTTHPGTILPDSEYFSVEAVDRWSRDWRADRVYMSEDYSAGEQFTVARGRIASLRGCRSRERQRRSRYSLTCYAFREIKFPSNQQSRIDRTHGKWRSQESSWDVAEFPVDGVDLHIHQEQQKFVLMAGADAPLPPSYATRLLEAIRFVSATEFWWDVLCDVPLAMMSPALSLSLLPKAH